MSAINKYVGKMFVDGMQGGWSEVYILSGVTPGDAKTDMAAIVAARLPMLDATLTITFANVSDLGVKRDSYLAINGTLAGTDTFTESLPNRDEDAFLLRQETADGRHANRYLHGVPDPCVVGGVYDPTGNGGNWETALAAYITAITTHTKYLNKVNPADPTTWTLVAWTNIYRRGITEHKVGRPFDTRRGRRNPGS